MCLEKELEAYTSWLIKILTTGVTLDQWNPCSLITEHQCFMHHFKLWIITVSCPFTVRKPLPHASLHHTRAKSSISLYNRKRAKLCIILHQSDMTLHMTFHRQTPFYIKESCLCPSLQTKEAQPSASLCSRKDKQHASLYIRKKQPPTAL